MVKYSAENNFNEEPKMDEALRKELASRASNEMDKGLSLEVALHSVLNQKSLQWTKNMSSEEFADIYREVKAELSGEAISPESENERRERELHEKHSEEEAKTRLDEEMKSAADERRDRDINDL